MRVLLILVLICMHRMHATAEPAFGLLSIARRDSCRDQCWRMHQRAKPALHTQRHLHTGGSAGTKGSNIPCNTGSVLIDCCQSLPRRPDSTQTTCTTGLYCWEAVCSKLKAKGGIYCTLPSYRSHFLAHTHISPILQHPHRSSRHLLKPNPHLYSPPCWTYPASLDTPHTAGP